MPINWNDPIARLRLAERVGPAEYNRLALTARADSVCERLNGHDLRPVQTRFGRLYAVGDTKRAFSTLEEARAFAQADG